MSAANIAPIALVDEMEYGLEPHRLMRFLDSLGAKDLTVPLQVFITRRSPVALRELSSNQLFVVRQGPAGHSILSAGNTEEVQGSALLGFLQPGHLRVSFDHGINRLNDGLLVDLLDVPSAGRRPARMTTSMTEIPCRATPATSLSPTACN